MLTRSLHHLRENLIAYLALFVALGGTSYAALNLPANSVGPRQIRNHSITGVKLDPRSIAGSIKAWVNLQTVSRSAVGVVSSSSPVRVRSVSDGESLQWSRLRFSRSCGASITPQYGANGGGFVTAQFFPRRGSLFIFGTTGAQALPLGAFVIIVCP